MEKINEKNMKEYTCNICEGYGAVIITYYHTAACVDTLFNDHESCDYNKPHSTKVTCSQCYGRGIIDWVDNIRNGNIDKAKLIQKLERFDKSIRIVSIEPFVHIIAQREDQDEI